MTFAEAVEKARDLGFGLVYQSGLDVWHVLRGRDLVHEADTPQAAVKFCEAWSAYVR